MLCIKVVTYRQWMMVDELVVLLHIILDTRQVEE